MNNGERIYYNLKEKYDLESILFCPYKEEMFDSMKTVYEAALNDGVRVGLMPIPYFGLKDLMPVSIHLEFDGQNFPGILNDGWDVIVFHYPYDNLNTITRPLITSKMLKCFCKKLVLINYACVGDRDIREDEMTKGAANSDLIITETEDQARQCHEHFMKHGIDKEFVGWGHPKYDNLIVDVSDEWKEKADGKHVILYQTSLIPMISRINRLEEIRNTISRLDKEENLIIWRPHPLILDGLKAIRPIDYHKFKQIVKEFKQTRHIFDDTADFRQAFTLSDEMISDGSSLDILYKSINKPITHE